MIGPVQRAGGRVGRFDRGRQFDEALPGTGFRGLDAFQLGVRAQDRDLDRERRARVALALAAQGRQRLRLRQQHPALYPAHLPYRPRGTRGRRRHRFG
jgi:hypothetical protein